MNSPVDVILDQDDNGEVEMGTLNLAGFAAPTYSTTGGELKDSSAVEATREAAVKEGR